MANTSKTGLGQFFNVARDISEIALNTASKAGFEAGRKTLAALRDTNRRNLLVTTVLNLVLLAVALTASLLSGDLQKIGIAAISVVNLVMIIRMIVKLVAFLQKTVKPWWYLIRFAVPCFLRGLVKLKSWSEATKATIRLIYRYFYKEKVPGIAKTLHILASHVDMVPSSDEIENKVIRDFYPLVKSYMIEALLYNAVLYGLGYGLFLFVVKNTVFVRVLHLTLREVLFYPLTFLKAKV